MTSTIIHINKEHNKKNAYTKLLTMTVCVCMCVYERDKIDNNLTTILVTTHWLPRDVTDVCCQRHSIWRLDYWFFFIFTITMYILLSY